MDESRDELIRKLREAEPKLVGVRTSSGAVAIEDFLADATDDQLRGVVEDIRRVAEVRARSERLVVPPARTDRTYDEVMAAWGASNDGRDAKAWLWDEVVAAWRGLDKATKLQAERDAALNGDALAVAGDEYRAAYHDRAAEVERLAAELASYAEVKVDGRTLAEWRSVGVREPWKRRMTRADVEETLAAAYRERPVQIATASAALAKVSIKPERDPGDTAVMTSAHIDLVCAVLGVPDAG